MATITVRHGSIIDGIGGSGAYYGGPGGIATGIYLAANEKVTSITYDDAREDRWGSPKVFCNLKIFTNMGTYGPYAENTDNCIIGAYPTYTRTIQTFYEFLQENARSNSNGYLYFLN